MIIDAQIAKEVDLLFRGLKARRGDYCRNPITGAAFLWGDDPIAPLKVYAVRALMARKWFELNGPADAPPLPLSDDEIDDARNARGLAGVVGFYARSLTLRCWDHRKHPPFEDLACGVMASNTGSWNMEHDEELKKRFPPCPLQGMDSGVLWRPPHEHAELMAGYSQRRYRAA